MVVITSNRTREVHDAIRRRCLYHWVDYPDAARERQILARKAPGVPARLSAQIVAFVQRLRGEELFKLPGVAETIDWAAALMHLDKHELDPAAVDETLGVLLKYQDDIARVKGAEAARLVGEARGGRRCRWGEFGRPPRPSPALVRFAAQAHRGGRKIAANILHFARLLRRAGLPVGPADVLAALEAVQLVDIGSRGQVRTALRATLIHRHEHADLFDQAFLLFWRDPEAGAGGGGHGLFEAGSEAAGARAAGQPPAGRGDGAAAGAEAARGGAARRSTRR